MLTKIFMFKQKYLKPFKHWLVKNVIYQLFAGKLYMCVCVCEWFGIK